jgi:hypothetical protein
MRFIENAATAFLRAAFFSSWISLSTTSRSYQTNLNARLDDVPPPPTPEPIEVTELTLPPVVSSDEEGTCTPDINPQRTGCTGIASNFFGGNFLPDGNHVVASLNFTGAPASPDPASIYTGYELILIKTDGTNFPGGSPWKCITCGVPAEQQAGRNAASESDLDPAPFSPLSLNLAVPFLNFLIIFIFEMSLYIK